jgi:hypothetical protein
MGRIYHIRVGQVHMVDIVDLAGYTYRQQVGKYWDQVRYMYRRWGGKYWRLDRAPIAARMICEVVTVDEGLISDEVVGVILKEDTSYLEGAAVNGNDSYRKSTLVLLTLGRSVRALTGNGGLQK